MEFPILNLFQQNLVEMFVQTQISEIGTKILYLYFFVWNIVC